MTSPRTLLRAWNMPARKQLGQHFLAEPSVADAIISGAGICTEDVVLEIGAGLGALTVPSARLARRVYAVEKDPRLVELLNTELAMQGITNVDIVEADVLSLDLPGFIEKIDALPIVIGNLPYNISSQILVRLILHRRCIQHAVLMFQKELAERLRASPGGKDYGRLSVMLQYCARLRTLLVVEASRFYPRPKVDSEVLEIRFQPPHTQALPDETWFFGVIKAAFGQRRKTLKNALTGSALGMSATQAVGALTAVGIDPRRRAETLSVEQFVKLSNALYRQRPAKDRSP